MLGSGAYNCCRPLAYNAVVNSLRILWLLVKHRSFVADKSYGPQVHRHHQHSSGPCTCLALWLPTAGNTQSPHCRGPTHSSNTGLPLTHAVPTEADPLTLLRRSHTPHLYRPTSCLRAGCWVGRVPRVGYLPWLSCIKSVLFSGWGRLLG